MTKKQYIGWGVCLWLMAACSGDEKMDSPSPQPEVTSYPISCSVRQVNSMQGTRALIETDAALQAACAGTSKDAIAIWGTYTLDGSNTPTTVFTDKALFYDASVGTNDETNQISWNYADEQYWVKDAAYTFRACYPQGVLTGSAVGISGTYNTLTTQKDLMVTSVQVNTATYDMSQPVPLEMNHALAAVKFVVKSADNTELTLQSLSLSGLKTQGTFTHNSTMTPALADWTNLSGTGSYGWTGSLPFNNDATEDVVRSYIGTSPLTTYAEDGFVLVIPQAGCTPLLTLQTNQKTYTNVSLHTGTTTYEPGKKYTYTITVNAADYKLSLTLDVQPWNLYEEEIEFTEELTIASDGQMKWAANPNVTVNAADRSILYINGCTDLASALVFNFQIDTPVGATWYASFEGDKDAFAFIDEEGNTLLNANGISSTSGNVGEPATLRVITVQQDVTEMKTVTLRIVVRTMDGRTIVAHEELMPIADKQYYTIRQNLTIVG